MLNKRRFQVLSCCCSFLFSFSFITAWVETWFFKIIVVEKKSFAEQIKAREVVFVPSDWVLRRNWKVWGVRLSPRVCYKLRSTPQMTLWVLDHQGLVGEGCVPVLSWPGSSRRQSRFSLCDTLLCAQCLCCILGDTGLFNTGKVEKDSA